MAFTAAGNEIHDIFNGLFAVQAASANFDDTHTVAPMFQTLLLQTFPFLGFGLPDGRFDTPNPMRSQGGGLSGAVTTGNNGSRTQRQALEKRRR
jgi:hypothetical protein